MNNGNNNFTDLAKDARIQEIEKNNRHFLQKMFNNYGQSNYNQCKTKSKKCTDDRYTTTSHK
jgi:hypothetical protein